MSQQPTVGRIVLYRLTVDQAKAMNERREHAQLNREKMRAEKPGFQAHIGNYCAGGVGEDVRTADVVPLLIVKVWPNEYGDKPGVNGQAFLDGNDTLWVTSAKEGEGAGEWFWPPRV